MTTSRVRWDTGPHIECDAVARVLVQRPVDPDFGDPELQEPAGIDVRDDRVFELAEPVEIRETRPSIEAIWLCE